MDIQRRIDRERRHTQLEPGGDYSDTLKHKEKDKNNRGTPKQMKQNIKIRTKKRSRIERGVTRRKTVQQRGRRVKQADTDIGIGYMHRQAEKYKEKTINTVGDSEKAH